MSAERGGLSRRGFLRVSAAAGGALLVGVHLPGCARHSISRRHMAEWAEETGELVPNAWIRITRDSRVIFTLDRVEMGQGTMTSHAMMVAEELEVDPADIEIEHAGAARAFDNPAFNVQVTGGSTSVVASWEPLRRAAAATRDMLRQAAALMWKVPVAGCVARGGAVMHEASGLSARYGELTEIAALLPVPSPRPKPREAFRVLGRSVPRVDARMKVDGSAVFGIDVVLPGMLTAVIVRPPVLGGRARAVGADAARARRGVRDVVETPQGVAVVADSYWRARTAARALEIEWDHGPLAGLDSSALRDELAARAREDGKAVRHQGNARRALSAAARVVQASYEAPYLAHATMEPMSCTARVTRDGCEIWASTQSPAMARDVASRVTGMAPRDITVHNTLLGGGFGRRLAQDYVAEAVYLSRAVDAPVKVVWSREDDMQNDYYRPLSYHLLEGGIDAEGRPVAWFHHIVSQSLMNHTGHDWLSSIAPDWVPQVATAMLGRSAARLFKNNVLTDQTSVEGASSVPYAIGDLRVEYTEHESGVPIGFWRSVGHSENAFVVESFIDELAHAAGRDPFVFRRELLGGSPRARAVLELAAARAGWDTPAPAGRFRGIAQHESFGSACAQVVEVSVSDGAVRVHRVVCAIDCGFAVNPDIVAAQMEGSIVFGLSAALWQEISFAGGRVQQSNFHDYPLLRMHEMPVIEVHIAPSDGPPTGVGEPGLPPIAPAVANAVFAATGVRVRRLPIEPALRRPA